MIKVEYLLVKEENQNCKTANALLSLIRTNAEFTVSKAQITYDKLKVEYTVKCEKVSNAKANERYFLLSLSVAKPKTDVKIQERVEKLGAFCKALRGIFLASNFGFQLVTLKDDVSAYYSVRAYPLLNDIENVMRKLIFKFMFTKIGGDWLKDATPKEVTDKITVKATKNNIKDVVQNSLYEADFIVLVDFLFKPYATLTVEKLMSKVRAAKKITDLKLTELEEILPKSNWDRYFGKFVEIESLNSKWEQLYDLRNKVAHNKTLIKADYDKVKELTSELSSKLLDAIEKIDKVKLKEQEVEEVKDNARQEIFFPNYTPHNPFDTALNFITTPQTPKSILELITRQPFYQGASGSLFQKSMGNFYMPQNLLGKDMYAFQGPDEPNIISDNSSADDKSTDSQTKDKPIS
jgi:hypothetical protein